MTEINDYISHLVHIQKILPKWIEEIIIAKQGKILQEIKLRLWNTGLDAKGNEILPSYKPSTIRWKKNTKYARTSHVTLRDTGAFYAGMYLFLSKDELFVSSRDPKTPSLIKKYGPDILGLTVDEQRILMYSILEPEIQKRLDELPDLEVLKT